MRFFCESPLKNNPQLSLSLLHNSVLLQKKFDIYRILRTHLHYSTHTWFFLVRCCCCLKKKKKKRSKKKRETKRALSRRFGTRERAWSWSWFVVVVIIIYGRQRCRRRRRKKRKKKTKKTKKTKKKRKKKKNSQRELSLLLSKCHAALKRARGDGRGSERDAIDDDDDDDVDTRKNFAAAAALTDDDDDRKGRYEMMMHSMAGRVERMVEECKETLEEIERKTTHLSTKTLSRPEERGPKEEKERRRQDS